MSSWRGVFWHRCPEHYTSPRSNEAWWAEKIDETVVRDLRQTSELERHGREVIRIWEHETRDPRLAEVAAYILERVGRRLPGPT